VPAKKKSKPRSARARGLRTLQHQTLPPGTRQAIDTEVWFRALVAARDQNGKRDHRWSTKDQVHDEAITWFLESHAQRAFESYPARRTADEDLTFWVDSKLMERARRMARRDGVKVARLIDAALTSYVKQHVPDALLNYRQRVQQEAARLYEGGARPQRQGNGKRSQK
jgi:predicted HicB family RNase H-like nuclease